MLEGKTRYRALKKLAVSVNGLIQPLGFEKSAAWKWARKNNWKHEEVDLVIKGDAQVILPSFRVSITGGVIVPFQINIGRYLHPDQGPDFDVRVPTLSFAINKFVTRTVNDLREALPWFQKFETPESCKAELALFLKPGCPAYIDILYILNSIKD